MPNVFVVPDHLDSAGLVKALLGSRVSAARRDAAVDALRRANPGRDLDRLEPGAIVVVPRISEAAPTAGRALDPVQAAVADLVGQAGEALDALSRAADAAEERRRADAEQVRSLLGSAEIKRATSGNPQLRKNMATVGKELDAADADAERTRAALDESRGIWLEQLSEIAGLAGGREK